MALTVRGGPRLFSAVGVILVAAVSAASATEITLRMKGGGFQVQGNLKSYDEKTYTIFSDTLGKMSLDATRFDCVGSGCPTGPIAEPVTVAAIAAGTSGKIKISGSNTVGNQLMPSIIQSYAARNNMSTTKVVGENPLNVTFKLSDAGDQEIAEVLLARYGSTTSFNSLLDGSTQIGMSSRPIKDVEVTRLEEAGLGDFRSPTHEHIIGLDGLLIVVSQDNPAVALTTDQIAKIFSGQIKNWSQVGLPPGKINVYAPTEDSGTFDTFNSLVLKANQVELTETAKRSANHAEQSDLVARDPNGIGVVGIPYARNTRAINIETSCGLIAKPTRFAMKTEEYPLTRRLYLYTSGTPEDSLARGILNFALSQEAQPIVAASDFVDQTPIALSFIEQSPRIAFALNAVAEDFDMPLMRTMISTLKNAERMSVTLRFKTGVAELDNKALSDIARLRELLSQPKFKGKTVMLVGYADSVGAFPLNLNLSRQRARAVQQALLNKDKEKLAGLKITNLAFSELAPVACNEVEEGRRFNRRVEVWVKN